MTGAFDPNAPGDWTKFGKGEVIKNMMKSMGYKEGEGLEYRGKVLWNPYRPRSGKVVVAIGAYGKEAVVGPKFGESAAEAQRRMIGEQKQNAGRKIFSIATAKNAWKISQLRSKLVTRR
ncbi:hypothetical protein COOONC_00458 [Cooperia oncophora]